jgi:transposase
MACAATVVMMRTPLVPDQLWNRIEPLLPPEPPKPKGGRPRIPDRAALTGIIFVLKSGIPWEMLPAEFGCGSGMTCWRRLRDWGRRRGSGTGCTKPCWTS